MPPARLSSQMPTINCGRAISRSEMVREDNARLMGQLRLPTGRDIRITFLLWLFLPERDLQHAKLWDRARWDTLSDGARQ